MKDLVDAGTSKRRRDELMSIQAGISEKNNKRRIGKIYPVLIEGFSEDTELLLQGRTAFMAPEVDGRVLINKGQARVGEIKDVLISEAYSYDLIGEIIS